MAHPPRQLPRVVAIRAPREVLGHHFERLAPRNHGRNIERNRSIQPWSVPWRARAPFESSRARGPPLRTTTQRAARRFANAESGALMRSHLR